MHTHRVLAGIVAGAVALACTSSTDPLSETETFSATLTTAAEVPPVTNAPGASGTARFTLRNGTSVDFTIDVTGLTGPPIGAHIHGPGAVGVDAGIIVDLGTLAAITSGRIATGSFSAATASGFTLQSVLTLMRNGNAYVNVHTALNPGGEIRGQLVQP